MKVNITNSFFVKDKGLAFTLNLSENKFGVIGNKYKILGEKIEVEGKCYIIKEVEKVRSAAPIEWEPLRPIGIIVEEIK